MLKEISTVFTELLNQGLWTQAKRIDNDIQRDIQMTSVTLFHWNIDSASFTQTEEACNKDKDRQMILGYQNERERCKIL